MSKYLKSFITACLVVCMTVCLGIFAAACTNNDGKFPESVTVTVKLEDNTPAVGVNVQLCVVQDNGKLGTCLSEVPTNAQGVATIPVDEATGKNYEVHLSNLPEGYDYVDSNNNSYTEAAATLGYTDTGKGIQIDVTKNSSPTITLKAKPAPVVTTTPIELGATNAVAGTSYEFTATEAGWYKVSTGEMANLTIDGTDTFDPETVVNLAANASVVISVSDDCELTVTKTEEPAIGSKYKPLALTLGGDAVPFSVNLVSSKNKQTGDDILNWEANYYATFTTDKAGTYKIIFTFSINDDDLDAVVSAGYAQPGLDYEYVDGGMYFITTEDCTASTKYTVNIQSYKEDYTGLVGEGTNSLSYTVKVEYVEDGGGEEEYDEIELGTAYDCDATIYKLIVETTANYTFTISDATLFDLVVANSLDNIDWGDITWGTDPETNTTLSTETVQLEAGTYYVAGYQGSTFTITAAN